MHFFAKLPLTLCKAAEAKGPQAFGTLAPKKMSEEKKSDPFILFLKILKDQNYFLVMMGDLPNNSSDKISSVKGLLKNPLITGYFAALS